MHSSVEAFVPCYSSLKLMHGFLIFKLFVLKNKIIFIRFALVGFININTCAEGNQIFTEQTEFKI